MVRVGQAGEHRDLRAVGIWAFVGSALFMFSALLTIDGYAIERKAADNAPGGFNSWRELNVTHLQSRWRGRRDAKGAFLLADVSGAVAWVSLIGPVSAATQLMGGFNGRSANRVVVACFNTAALVTILDFVFQAGTVSLVDWVSTWPVMQGAGGGDGDFTALQTLEIAWLVASARTVWLFALDELLLTIGWATVAFLVYTSRGHGAQPLSRNWAHLSVLGAIIAFIGFACAVARQVEWMTMDYAATVANVLVYLLLLPIWLGWLGQQLRARSEILTYASSGAAGADDFAAQPSPQPSAVQSSGQASLASASADKPAAVEMHDVDLGAGERAADPNLFDARV